MNIPLGAVVIGRNEGPRLLECLASVRAQVERIVYVDSGSIDGSVEAAGRLGVHTISIQTGPLSAARGRHLGLEHLRREFPGIEFALFIDGDCTLESGFVHAAAKFLRENEKVGAVAGRVRECGTGFWSRVIDIEWEHPPGPVVHVGGNSMMRVRAITEAGGWPIDVIAGEEPELCLRMKDRGWDSHQIDVEMVRHDIRMTRFSQFWRRSVRAGHAYAEVSWRQRKGHVADRARAVASILLYGLFLPLLIIAASVLYWPVAVVVALLYVRLIVAVTIRIRRTGRPASLAFAYAMLTAIGKFAGVIGVARFAFGMLTGKRARIIEFRKAPPSGITGASPGPLIGKTP